MVAAHLNSRHASFALRRMLQAFPVAILFLKYFSVRETYLFAIFLGVFEDDDVTHIEGDVNPVRDLDIISEELRLKDVEFLNAHLEKLEKLVIRGNDKKLKPEYVSN